METSLVHTPLVTSKIDPFNGTFFKRCQEKVFFAIDVVKLEHVLTNLKLKDNFKNLPTWEIRNKQDMLSLAYSQMSCSMFDVNIS